MRARVWFDEWVGVEATALDDVVIEQLRPAVYRCIAHATDDTLYMKVHNAWACTDHGEGLFPADITAGVIYILRNPLDLAPSCAHHWGISIAQAVENLCNPDFTMTRSLGGLIDQLRQHVRSWSGHVHSWLDASGLPICLVHYEDLRRDSEGVFGEVVRFCGLRYDEARVCKAVAFSDFAELQRQEQAAGFAERSTKAPGSFFRRGQVRSWSNELAPHLVQRLIEAHRETMRRFGYLDEHHQLVGIAQLNAGGFVW